MPKSQDLFYNNFQRGIGVSPYTGFGRFQNMEIFQIPGVIKMKYRQVKKYSTLGLPIAIVHDYLGNEWAYTNNNYLYKNGVANYQTGTYNGVGNGFDMKIVAGVYIMITRGDGRNVYIDIISVQTSSYFFFPAWQQVSYPTVGGTAQIYNAPIQVLTGNQYIYIGFGNNVATIQNFTANSNPAAAPTGVFVSTAIPLQAGDYCRTLGLLGRNLLIGTQGGSSFADLTFTQANIYPYDLSQLLLGIPIYIEENGINQIFTYNNQAYIHAGIYGNIYVTNGSSIEFYNRVSVVNRSFGTTMLPWPNAINYVNNRLLIGTGNVNASDTFPSTSYHGIYELQGSGKTSALNFQTISTLNVGVSQSLAVGAILPLGNDNLVVGWQDGGSYGVDATDGAPGTPGLNGTYQSFSCFFECPVDIIAEPQNTETYDDIIVYLADPLIAGQQIQLWYKDGRSNAYVPIVAANGNAYLDSTCAPAGSTALFAKSRIDNVNTVQIKCAVSQGLGSPYLNGINISILGIKVLKHTNG